MRRMPRPQDQVLYKCESCRLGVIGKGDIGGWKPVMVGGKTQWFCDKPACKMAADDAVGRGRIERAKEVHEQLAEHVGQPINNPLPTLTSRADPAELERKLVEMEVMKDGAYAERNRCVVGLCRLAMALGFQAGLGEHEPNDESWEADWRGIVYIDFPSGQVSWHIHDSERGLFGFLPPYVGQWDGHDTATKYQRVMNPGAMEVRPQTHDVLVGEDEGQSTAPEEAPTEPPEQLEATVVEVEAEGVVEEVEDVGRPTARFGKKLIEWIQEHGWDDEPIMMRPSAYPNLQMDKLDPEILRDGIDGFFEKPGLKVASIEKVVMEGQFVGIKFTLVKRD